MSDPLDDLLLPEPPASAGAYAGGVIHCGIGFLSGQFPLRGGALVHSGRVGAEVSEEEGRFAAEVAALNVIAQIKALLGGSLADLATLLRVDGHVASAEDFIGQPAVLDGASEMFRRLLGDRGRHARTAFAASRLPLDAPIELAVTFGVATRAPRHRPARGYDRKAQTTRTSPEAAPNDGAHDRGGRLATATPARIRPRAA